MSTSTRKRTIVSAMLATAALALVAVGVPLSASATEGDYVPPQVTTSGGPGIIASDAQIICPGNALEGFGVDIEFSVLLGSEPATVTYGADAQQFSQQLDTPGQLYTGLGQFVATGADSYTAWITVSDGVGDDVTVSQTITCPPVQPPFEPAILTVTLTGVCVGTVPSVSYDLFVEPNDEEGPFTATVLYGEGETAVAAQLNAANSYRQTGTFPFASGPAEFAVPLGDSPVAQTYTVTVPTCTDGGGGDSGPGDGGNGGNGGDNGNSGGTDGNNGGGTTNPDGTIVVPGAPGATGDFIVPANSVSGPNGLLIGGLSVMLAGLLAAGFFGRRAIQARRTN
jgi:hypothetical protein